MAPSSGRLRRRGSSNVDPSLMPSSPPISLPNRSRTQPQRSLRWIVAAVIHLLSVSCVVYGILLRSKFHSGVECDMTYSMRQFLPIEMPTPYNLFKFIDQRDPRHRRFHGSGGHLRDVCTPDNQTHIVLYVPGHWGSYTQARSLGAHGLQLTRQHHPHTYTNQVVQSLATREWNGNAADEKRFVYDVYAIDFLDQGAGLHAKFLHLQSTFVADTVQMLQETCHVGQVTIVGHSLGGIVARAAVILHPRIRPFVKNIITLASPHWKLSYGFDETVPRFYSQVLHKDAEQASELLMVSVSGGIRDELIPPELCHVDATNSLSLLANDIMSPRQDGAAARFGMDHRAIVWCHNLLSSVRTVIHVLATVGTRETSAADRLDAVKSTLGDSLLQSTYSDRVADQREVFRHTYGYWNSVAMESSMIYHAELLVGLYAATAGIYLIMCNFSRPMWWDAFVVPIGVSIVAWMLSDVQVAPPCFVLLSFVANAVFLCLHSALVLLANRRAGPISTKSMLLGGLVAVASWLVYWRSEIQSFPVSSVLFLGTTSWLPVLALLVCHRGAAESTLTLVALILPAWPCLVFGKIVMTVWWSMRFSDTADLWSFLWRVSLPLCLRLGLKLSAKHSLRWVAGGMRLLVVAWVLPHLVQVGGGYFVGHLLAYLSWIDVILTIFASLGRQK